MQLVLLRKQKAELYNQAVRWVKSDERTLADALDYVKAEAQRLKDKKEDLLKNLQEANSAACELQNEINKKEVDIGKLRTKVDSKILVINELTRISKEKDKSIKEWEE